MVNQSQFIEILNSAEKKVAIGDVISKASKGKTPQYVEHSNVRVMNQACVHWDGMHWENVKYQDPGKLSNKEALNSFDILLNSTGTGTLGRCNIFYKPDDDYTYIPDGHLTVLNTNQDVMRPWLLVYFIKLEDVQREIYDDCVTGSTNQVDLVRKNFLKIRIPLPDMASQIRFDEIVTQADKSKFAGFKSQFISQFGFPQDGDVKHPTSSIEALLEETISGEWGTDCADASGTRVIRTTNFTNDGVLNLDDVVLRSIDQKKVEKKQLHKGDIILEKSGGTKDNPVGRLVYFAEDGIYLANNFTQVLRPSNSVNSGYLFAALYYLYQTHKPLIKGLGNQTNGIQNLKVPQYLQLQVCVPDRKEQDAFEQVMQRADKSKYLN